jgi:hypothetical protein
MQMMVVSAVVDMNVGTLKFKEINMYEDILKIVEKYFGSVGCEDCECCAQEIAIKLSDPDGYAEIFDKDFERMITGVDNDNCESR